MPYTSSTGCSFVAFIVRWQQWSRPGLRHHGNSQFAAKSDRSVGTWAPGVGSALTPCTWCQNRMNLRTQVCAENWTASLLGEENPHIWCQCCEQKTNHSDSHFICVSYLFSIVHNLTCGVASFQGQMGPQSLDTTGKQSEAVCMQPRPEGTIVQHHMVRTLPSIAIPAGARGPAVCSWQDSPGHWGG